MVSVGVRSIQIIEFPWSGCGCAWLLVNAICFLRATMVAIIQFEMTWIIPWSIWLQDVSNSIEFGILIGLPCQVHSESTLIGVLFVCLGLTMLQIIVARTPWCVSIQLEVSIGSDSISGRIPRNPIANNCRESLTCGFPDH